MKNPKKKLRQIKKKLACWDKQIKPGKCGASDCSSSSGDGCHGDGSCGGDGD